MMRVLVVDSDSESSKMLCTNLRRLGHEVLGVPSGRRALETYHRADLVLLGLGLSDRDGLEVCRDIRSAGDTPIIALSCGRTELDRVLGLQAGADDCLEKPFGFRELVARIDAVMRRSRPRTTPAGTTVAHGPLRIDAATREVRVHGRLVEVTRKEFDLLYHLARRPGVVISRKQLMAEIWGTNPGVQAASPRMSRTIDTHVSTLRSKLGARSWILTVRGVGFRLGLG